MYSYRKELLQILSNSKAWRDGVIRIVAVSLFPPKEILPYIDSGKSYEIKVGFFEKNEILALLKLGGLPTDDATIKEIHDITGYHPLLAAHICDTLFHNKQIKITKDILDSKKHIIRETLQSKILNKTQKLILIQLANSGTGLEEREIFGQIPEINSNDDLNTALKYLEDFGYIEKIDVKYQFKINFFKSCTTDSIIYRSSRIDLDLPLKLIERDDCEGAIRHISKLKEDIRNDDLEYLNVLKNLAKILNHCKKFYDVINLFKSLQPNQQSDFIPYLHEAALSLYNDSKNLNERIDIVHFLYDYDKSEEVKHKYGEILFERGCKYEESDIYESAKDDFQRANTLDYPGSKEKIDHIQSILYKKECDDLYKKLYNLNVHDDNANKRLEEIKLLFVRFEKLPTTGNFLTYYKDKNIEFDRIYREKLKEIDLTDYYKKYSESNSKEDKTNLLAEMAKLNPFYKNVLPELCLLHDNSYQFINSKIIQPLETKIKIIPTLETEIKELKEELSQKDKKIATLKRHTWKTLKKTLIYLPVLVLVSFVVIYFLYKPIELQKSNIKFENKVYFRDRIDSLLLSPKLIIISGSDAFPAKAVGNNLVTVHEYRLYTEKTGKILPPENDQLADSSPVLGLSPTEVKNYVKWLSYNTGEQYSILRYSEWMYYIKAHQLQSSIYWEMLLPDETTDSVMRIKNENSSEIQADDSVAETGFRISRLVW